MMYRKIMFKTSVIILLLVIHKVMYAAEPEDPCASNLDHIVANMCTDDSAIEDNNDGTKQVDSVLLRITKQQNNCICHVSLQNNATNYTIHMSKYQELHNAAPEQQNCGLAVDVEYIDILDTTRSLQSIACTSGTSMRSIALGGSELQLKSRIINGDFARDTVCKYLERGSEAHVNVIFAVPITLPTTEIGEAIYTCSMIDQINTAGSDGDWIMTSGTQHTSFDNCKRYCLLTETCVAVHYNSNYCFVYNRTTTVILKADSIYSQKHCVDAQKLKLKCYPPESTTQTSQVITTEYTFSTKTETGTKPIDDTHVTRSNTQSTIEREKEFIKDNNRNEQYRRAGNISVLRIDGTEDYLTFVLHGLFNNNTSQISNFLLEKGNASLPVIIVAVVGWCFTALFAITTFCLYQRSNRPRPTVGRELNANNNYDELSASRLSSNYNSLNLSTVTT